MGLLLNIFALLEKKMTICNKSEKKNKWNSLLINLTQLNFKQKTKTYESIQISSFEFPAIF